MCRYISLLSILYLNSACKLGRIQDLKLKRARAPVLGRGLGQSPGGGPGGKVPGSYWILKGFFGNN